MIYRVRQDRLLGDGKRWFLTCPALAEDVDKLSLQILWHHAVREKFAVHPVLFLQDITYKRDNQLVSLEWNADENQRDARRSHRAPQNNAYHQARAGEHEGPTPLTDSIEGTRI